MKAGQDVKISFKKEMYPCNEIFTEYLEEVGREQKLSLMYDDLLRFTNFVPVYDNHGKDTLWINVIYSYFEQDEIHKHLIELYTNLSSDGTNKYLYNLAVDRIDFCTFGNSKPFRIKIINKFNENYDYFYIKQMDVSRVLGLELEHYLSPNHMNYITCKNTLVEEHIAGIPGDLYMKKYTEGSLFNKIRMAKEFTKFNERCFWRLLGDMRSYNFVVVVTHDFDQIQYKIRAIDFDQQCYEGKLQVYKPQFFKENFPYVQNVTQNLLKQSIIQYQNEERSLIARRIRGSYERIKKLLECLDEINLSNPHKINELARAVSLELKNSNIQKSQKMTDILQYMFEHLYRYYFLEKEH